VLLRFRCNSAQEQAELRSSRIAGVLLFALAACVVATSTMAIVGYGEPRPTLLGVGILITAAVFMPLLAREKRRLSAETSSAALRADAAESALCGYLSLIALLGLVINALWHVRWADPAAAILTIPVILREGWEAVRGRPCECG